MDAGNRRYPKGERVFCGYYDREGSLLYIVTAKEPARDWYFLYEPSGEGFKKLGKAREPPELIERFRVEEHMRGEA